MYFLLLLIPVASVYGTTNKLSPPYSCYECFGSECNSPFNKTCDGALKCLTRIALLEDMTLLPEKGCLRVPFIMLALCMTVRLKMKDELNEVTSCCEGNFCNKDEFILPSIPGSTIPPTTVSEWEYIDGVHYTTVLFAFSTFIVVSSLVLGTVWFLATRKKPYKQRQNQPLNITVNDSFCDCLTTCTKSCSPSLGQRCFAQDVDMIQRIGRGQYADVWQGVKNGENVAVKIFSSEDEAMWQNEVNIYTKFGLSHENILAFKGSVITSRFGFSELWLLTTFYEEGSLYEYLIINSVTHEQMMQLVQSACLGLLYLHMEIFSSDKTGKPAIAHRDLKSKNIFVTSRGTCVISDFRLAITKGHETSSNSIPINYQVGTERYMAPEVLDGSINTNSFESFKRADMYAFALIMWEVCSRCVVNGKAEDYRLPFEDDVPGNFDIQDMKRVVCDEWKRPNITCWSTDTPLTAMAELMKRCWHKFPEFRYSAPQTMRALEKIHAEMEELKKSTAESVESGGL